MITKKFLSYYGMHPYTEELQCIILDHFIDEDENIPVEELDGLTLVGNLLLHHHLHHLKKKKMMKKKITHKGWKILLVMIISPTNLNLKE
jgi:hypothetical protein